MMLGNSYIIEEKITVRHKIKKKKKKFKEWVFGFIIIITLEFVVKSET